MNIKFPFISSTKTSGVPPGTLMYIGAERNEPFRYELCCFDAEQVERKNGSDIKEALSELSEDGVNWLNIVGIHDIESIRILGEHLHIDALVLEDVLNAGHRPKIEMYEGFRLFIAKMIQIKENQIYPEQLSCVLAGNVVVTFQETSADVFDPLRKRIESGPRRKLLDPYYLFYAILDVLVDEYFEITSYIEHYLDRTEDKVLKVRNDKLLFDMKQYKDEINMIRKLILPLRNGVAYHLKEGHIPPKGLTRKYYLDLHDHLSQIIDQLDGLKDRVVSLQDLYLSVVSHRMNNVMQVLTIIATIFIPLTFLAGIYGMNFEYMPELQWKYGYFGVLGVMLLVTIIMLLFFKRKKWF